MESQFSQMVRKLFSHGIWEGFLKTSYPISLSTVPGVSFSNSAGLKVIQSRQRSGLLVLGKLNALYQEVTQWPLAVMRKISLRINLTQGNGKPGESQRKVQSLEEAILEDSV